MDSTNIAASSAEHSTARIMAAIEIKARKKGENYACLVEWPDLAPAVAVHINLGNHKQRRLPVKLMRKVGLRPEAGVHIGVKNNRALMWDDARIAGAHKQDEESKNFFLPGAGLGAKLSKSKFAIVEGPDYLIVTTKQQALAMAGSAPVHEHNDWERMTERSVPRIDEEFVAESVDVLDWQDFTLFHQNLRAKTGVASVSGRLWWLAGFVGGDTLRFTRYKNATIIEKGAPTNQHSVLTQGKQGVPRHYIGASLFDFHKSQRVRVLAVAGKLIVTLPDSAVGLRATGVTSKAPLTRQSVAPTYQPSPPEECLAADLKVLARRDVAKQHGSIMLTGRPWHVAGFERLQPARMRCYANAVVIEPCSESEMDFRIGCPSQRYVQRSISLGQTVLAHEKRIRILVCDGRIVLTGRNSDFGRKFRGIAEWPEKVSDVAEFIDNLRRPPAVEVSSYQLPGGRRLQIQGKWLGQFGFVPGARYEVAPDKQGVSLRLVAEGGAAVTHLNPGSDTGKLYVPAQSLAKLKAEKVRVLGRAGELRLLPLAA